MPYVRDWVSMGEREIYLLETNKAKCISEGQRQRYMYEKVHINNTIQLNKGENKSMLLNLYHSTIYSQI